MQRIYRYFFLSASVAVVTLLAFSLGQRRAGLASDKPLDDWDIPELAHHLNQAGLKLSLLPVPYRGAIGPSAFLASTDKGWHALNNLSKNPKRIEEWRGVLYCERVDNDPTDLANQWGDLCLVVGPFLFYGDAELRDRVRAALASFVPR